MKKDPDPHGQAALMLCEILLILLVERGLVSKAVVVEAIADVIEVKREIAGATESMVVSMASIGLLRAVAQSLSAVTPGGQTDRGPDGALDVDRLGRS